MKLTKTELIDKFHRLNIDIVTGNGTYYQVLDIISTFRSLVDVLSLTSGVILGRNTLYELNASTKDILVKAFSLGVLRFKFGLAIVPVLTRTTRLPKEIWFDILSRLPLVNFNQILDIFKNYEYIDSTLYMKKVQSMIYQLGYAYGAWIVKKFAYGELRISSMIERLEICIRHNIYDKVSIGAIFNTGKTFILEKGTFSLSLKKWEDIILPLLEKNYVFYLKATTNHAELNPYRRIIEEEFKHVYNQVMSRVDFLHKMGPIVLDLCKSFKEELDMESLTLSDLSNNYSYLTIVQMLIELPESDGKLLTQALTDFPHVLFYTCIRHPSSMADINSLRE